MDIDLNASFFKSLTNDDEEENGNWTINIKNNFEIVNEINNFENVYEKNNIVFFKKKLSEKFFFLKPIYVLSSFEVTKGVYFYEIEIIKTGFIGKTMTGFISKFDDLYFMFRSFLEHDEDDSEKFFEKSFMFYKTNNLPGDIIGCLVNVEQQKIIVYYNGKLVLINDTKNKFKTLPIFALTINYCETIRVNYGNTAFKYPPLNEYYETFHSITLKKFPLFKIQIKTSIKWFCNMSYDEIDKIPMIVFDYNQNYLEPSLLHFNDLKQKQFDQIIIDLETNINNGYKEILDCIVDIVMKLSNNLKIYRFLQSIVETTGDKIETYKLSKLDYIYFVLIAYQPLNISTCHLFLHEYILNFFKTKNNQKNNTSQTKFHYMCLILFFIIKSHSLCTHIIEQCKIIFCHVLQHSNDSWSQLYSIMGLIHYDRLTPCSSILKQYLLELISKKETTLFHIWRNFNKENALKNTRIKGNLAQLQIYQYLKNFLPKFLNTEKDNVSSKNLDFEVSNTKQFIFSFSNLMVRNYNYGKKTIRYKFSISPPSFYFEVTIITPGFMTIGLAVKQMDIENEVGQNAFSIGIDGFRKCVWMHKKKYKFTTSRPSWNAGDVIGIYVDFANRAVIFGINNKIIELDGDPFEEEFIFSILPCHVAASLDCFQQCYFNFDCKIIPRVFLNKLEPINQNVNNIHNSVLTSGSTATIGNITISDMSNQLSRVQTLNYDRQLNFIMKSDEATGRSLQTWSSVTGEINLAYGRVLSESYKKDTRITLDACEQWCNQMESVLRDIRNPVQYYDEYMRKIGEIHRKLENDAQKINESSLHSQLLMLMPAPVEHVLVNSFTYCLNELKMALCDRRILLQVVLILSLIFLYTIFYSLNF